MATSALGRPRPCGWGWVVLAPAAAASTSAAGVAEDSATSLASQMRFSESHQGRDSFPPLLSFVSATEKNAHCWLFCISFFYFVFSLKMSRKALVVRETEISEQHKLPAS